MKTIEDLKNHLFEYRNGIKSLPNYVELAELCGINKNNEEILISDKLVFISNKCKKGEIIDWEANYIFNCWVSSNQGTNIDSLNKRQTDFINLVYERTYKR